MRNSAPYSIAVKTRIARKTINGREALWHKWRKHSSMTGKEFLGWNMIWSEIPWRITLMRRVLGWLKSLFRKPSENLKDPCVVSNGTSFRNLMTIFFPFLQYSPFTRKPRFTWLEVNLLTRCSTSLTPFFRFYCKRLAVSLSMPF